LRNLMVYAKGPNSKRFMPVNISTGEIGVLRVYATLIPECDMDDLIQRVRKARKIYPDHSFEIRYAGKGGRKARGLIIGDRVRVYGEVKYGNEWYDADTEGTIVDFGSRSTLVTLDRIDGDSNATCFVANKHITLLEE